MKHAKKLAISSFKIFLMAIFFSRNAQAYSFTDDFNKGFYWQSLPVKMEKFVTDPADAGLLEQLTNESVLEWENASGSDLWEFSQVKNTTNFSGNYIRWSDHFGEETGYDPSRTLAITIRYNAGTFFQQTLILLNGNLSYLRSNWGGTLKKTILHEIGHTLGLDHSSVSAIMAPSISEISSLQPDDIDGIMALVDETTRRQSVGFVSPFSQSQSSKNSVLAACGTVEEVGKGQPPSNGAGQFMGSMLIGVVVMYLLNQGQRKKVFVRY